MRNNPRMAFRALRALLALLFLHSDVFTSRTVAADEYSYDPCSPLGPQNWGYLKEDWAACANGEQQTPISIKPSNIFKKKLSPLKKHYTQRPAVLLNRGHDIMVNWTTSPGYLEIGGNKFHLQQCHWHSPSEHEFFGKRYPLELHMVHSSSDSETAVIGVLYEFGGYSDPFLNKLMNTLNELKTGDSVDLGYIEPPSVGEGASYFSYSGSLTTPPCSEPVKWTVMRKVQSVTEEQLELLRAPVGYKDNARPIQPINGRKVYLYEPRNEQEEDHASS